MQNKARLWLPFLCSVLIGIVVGWVSFDSMQTPSMRIASGACMGAAVGLLFLLDKGPRTVLAIGCGALIFAAILLNWIDTPDSSATSLLIGGAAAIAAAWGAHRI